MTRSQFRKLGRILFSLGRIPRITFWVVSVILYPFLYFMSMVIRILDKNHPLPWVALAFFPIAVYLVFALYIERLHDRDKNGWWSLFMLVPIVNSWFLIEMLFFRGTHGPNRFGPDPLATNTTTTDVAAGDQSRVSVEAEAAPVPLAQVAAQSMSEQVYKARFRLNGWQRIGVALSCCWAVLVVADVLLWFLRYHEEPIAPFGWKDVLAGALYIFVPILVAWVVIVAVKWIRIGFNENPKQNLP